jgi:hypothetical protein
VFQGMGNGMKINYVTRTFFMKEWILDDARPLLLLLLSSLHHVSGIHGGAVVVEVVERMVVRREARFGAARGGIRVVVGRVTGDLKGGAARAPAGAAAILEAAGAVVLANAVPVPDVGSSADEHHQHVHGKRKFEGVIEAADHPRPRGDARVVGRDGVAVFVVGCEHVVLVREPRKRQRVVDDQNNDEDPRHRLEGRPSCRPGSAGRILRDRRARRGKVHSGHDLTQGQRPAAAREPHDGMTEAVLEAVAQPVPPLAGGDAVAAAIDAADAGFALADDIPHELLPLLHAFRRLEVGIESTEMRREGEREGGTSSEFGVYRTAGEGQNGSDET